MLGFGSPSPDPQHLHPVIAAVCSQPGMARLGREGSRGQGEGAFDPSN